MLRVAQVTDEISDVALAVKGHVLGVEISGEALQRLPNRDLDALSDFMDGLALHQSSRLVQLLECREDLKDKVQSVLRHGAGFAADFPTLAGQQVP